MANDATPLGDRFRRADKVIAAAIERTGELTVFEADFASQLADRLGEHGARTLMTPKQMGVVGRLARKLEVPL